MIYIDSYLKKKFASELKINNILRKPKKTNIATPVSRFNLELYFHLKFLYFQAFKPKYFSHLTIGPEEIMIIEENYNNSRNVFILKNTLDFFSAYWKYRVKKSYKKDSMKFYNCLFLILSKFFEKNTFISFKMKKFINIYFKTNSESEHLLKPIIHPDVGSKIIRFFWLTSFLSRPNPIKYCFYNSIPYAFSEFFYFKNKLFNLSLKTEKFSLETNESFTKNIFFIAKSLFINKQIIKFDNSLNNSLRLIQKLNII